MLFTLLEQQNLLKRFDLFEINFFIFFDNAHFPSNKIKVTQVQHFHYGC